MQDVLAYAITAILGGGLFKGIEAIYRAITDSREKQTLATAIGAKTPVEIESVSVATMTTALESAQKRISSLEKERQTDHQFYQDRIKDLTDQLTYVRLEMMNMAKKIQELDKETKGHGTSG